MPPEPAVIVRLFALMSITAPPDTTPPEPAEFRLMITSPPLASREAVAPLKVTEPFPPAINVTLVAAPREIASLIVIWPVVPEATMSCAAVIRSSSASEISRVSAATSVAEPRLTASPTSRGRNVTVWPTAETLPSRSSLSISSVTPPEVVVTVAFDAMVNFASSPASAIETAPVPFTSAATPESAIVTLLSAAVAPPLPAFSVIAAPSIPATPHTSPTVNPSVSSNRMASFVVLMAR